MKVDVVTGYRWGGPQTWARDLAQLLNSNGVDARHLYRKHELLFLPLLGHADIVHTTVPIPFGICRKPMVLTIQGDYTIENNLWCRYYPDTMKRAEIITTSSQYLKDKLQLDRALVIPNAVLPEKFRVVEQGEQKWLKLTTICNMYFLDKAEGLLRLFDILRSLDNIPFVLTVVGDGTYRKHIENGAAGVDVRFVGFMPDVRPILQDTDIFLHYSIHDNFPIVLLEAMASGLPVITNRVGAVGEIIDCGRDGHVASDEEDYASALRYLMHSHTLRQEMGKQARQTVEDKFDWHKVIDDFVEIYRGVAQIYAQG